MEGGWWRRGLRAGGLTFAFLLALQYLAGASITRSSKPALARLAAFLSSTEPPTTPLPPPLTHALSPDPPRPPASDSPVFPDVNDTR